MKNIFSIVAACAFGGILTSCSLDSLVKVDQPIGTDVEHKYLDTQAGALELLYSAFGTLQEAVSTTSEEVSYFTDELLSRPPASGRSLDSYSSDTRFEKAEGIGILGIQFPSYAMLQSARLQASYAKYFLKRQGNSALNYAISAAYSFEGYAITMLAENVCSGIPLSEAPYGQSAVYGRGLPTDTLFLIAIAKFDSALALPHDSLRFQTLAKIGKARALVSIGRYREASEAIADVGPNDVFNLTYTEAITPNPNDPNPLAKDAFWTLSSTSPQTDASEIVNMEGGNGLIWYSDPSNLDPRLPVTVKYSEEDQAYHFPSVVRQQKFPNGNVMFKLASWVEAKMIEAEYLLNNSDESWIEPLNAARRSVGLPDTVSPTTQAQKVTLLFRERAFWFYGQGTRLSDMRRLVRQYRRPVTSVYPIGRYTRSMEVFSYGDATVFIPSKEEFRDNYNYTGCIHKNP